MRGRSVVTAGACLLLLWGVGSSHADGRQQAQQQATQAQAQEDTVRLVFEREVFRYPEFARRNPFRPLTQQEDGPRFQDLVLLGVMADPDPSYSLAVLGMRGAPAGAQSHRLRVGESIGNSRVLEIRRAEVIMEVEEFGTRETRVLELRRGVPVARPPEDPATDTVDAADTLTADTLQTPPQGADPDTEIGAGTYENGGS